MDLVLLDIALAVDDGGVLVAVFRWVEVLLDVDATMVHIEAQPWMRLERVSVN